MGWIKVSACCFHFCLRSDVRKLRAARCFVAIITGVSMDASLSSRLLRCLMISLLAIAEGIAPSWRLTVSAQHLLSLIDSVHAGV